MSTKSTWFVTSALIAVLASIRYIATDLSSNYGYARTTAVQYPEDKTGNDVKDFLVFQPHWTMDEARDNRRPGRCGLGGCDCGRGREVAADLTREQSGHFLSPAS